MNLYMYSLQTLLVILLWIPVPTAVLFIFQCKCLPMKLLHKLLRKLDIVERGPEDSDEEPQSTLHGYEVPLLSVWMFIFCLSSICLTIGIAFINTLLVQTTTSCNPKMDCFLVNSLASVDLSKPAWHIMPVNCNNLTDDLLFVCYKFQFDLAKALAVAGGLITIAKLTINITLSVLFWLMNRQTRKRKLIVTFIIIFSMFMLFFIFFTAYLILWKSAEKATAFFITDGLIPSIQLIVFFLTAIAATLAVACVHFPTFANKLMSHIVLPTCTFCCKRKHYGYIQIGHNDLNVWRVDYCCVLDFSLCVYSLLTIKQIFCKHKE